MRIRFFLFLSLLSLFLQTCSSDGGISGGNGGQIDPNYPQEDMGLPSSDIYNNPPDYDALFNPVTIKTIRIYITTGEWNCLLNDYDANHRNETYRKAAFLYGTDANNPDVVMLNVGFRLRGNWTSRRRPEIGESGSLHAGTNVLRRVHFKIKFNEQFVDNEACYGGYSRDIPTINANQGRSIVSNVRVLNLKHNHNDSSYLREVFAYDIFHRYGVPAPRAAFTRFYIKIGNEAERYLGVFSLVEHVDKMWIRKRYGVSSYLFKCLYQDDIADLSTTDNDGNNSTGLIGQEITDPSDSRWTGSYYRPSYDIKAKKTEFLQAQNALNSLISLLQGSPDSTQLEAQLDVQALLKAQALNAYLGMWDDYWRNGNNYYLLYRPTDSKWLFIPYDYDHAFDDNAWAGTSPPASASFTNWGEGGNGTPLLMEKVLAIPQFMENYKSYIQELYNTGNDYFNWSSIQTRMQQLQSVIAPHTSEYDGTDEDPYSSDLSAFQDFVSTRLSKAIQEAP